MVVVPSVKFENVTMPLNEMLWLDISVDPAISFIVLLVEPFVTDNVKLSTFCCSVEILPFAVDIWDVKLFAVSSNVDMLPSAFSIRDVNPFTSTTNSWYALLCRYIRLFSASMTGRFSAPVDSYNTLAAPFHAIV